MRKEYDFSAGKRGVYSKRYKEDSTVIVLEPDVASLFEASKSVNDALRTLVKIANKHGKK